MTRLEEITQGAHVKGLDPASVATVEGASWIGDKMLKVIYRTADGALRDRLVLRDDEPRHEAPILVPLRHHG